MSPVLLIGDGPEHRYVANRLDDSIGLDAIIVDVGVPQRRSDRLRQLRRRYSTTQLASRALYAGFRRVTDDVRERHRQVSRVLGADSEQLNRRGLGQTVHGINTPETWARLDALQPDRILVYGTGIIGDRALAHGNATPLNMHTGISPEYRGSSCAFWPLYNRELDLLGATIHEVSSDVDGGRILATARARLEPSDDVHRVFARCVQAGAELYAEVLDNLGRGSIEAKPQDLSVGREYRAAMRGPVAEFQVRWAIRRGLINDYCRERSRDKDSGR